MTPTDSTTVPAAPGASEEHVLDATGHIHVTDAPIDLSHYSLEAWLSLGIFWILGADIFYQFFTRYALNDSAAWTEEIARYLLICTVFIAIADFADADDRETVRRVLSTLVDLIRLVFFAYAVYLTWAMMQKMGNYRMTIVDLPMNTVYAVCLIGFAFSAVRSVQVLIINWRRGYSVLERPEITLEGHA